MLIETKYISTPLGSQLSGGFKTSGISHTVAHAKYC